MRIYQDGTMVRLDNELTGAFESSLPKNILQLQVYTDASLPTSGLQIIVLTPDYSAKVYTITDYDIADPAKRTSDALGVIDATLALAIARLNTFIGFSSGSGTPTIAGTLPVISSSLGLPSPAVTVSFDILGLPLLAAPSGDEFIVVQNTAGAVFNKYALSAVSPNVITEYFTPIDNQTVFNLSFPPILVKPKSFFINGVQRTYGSDYTIAGVILTYIPTAYPILANQKDGTPTAIEFTYYY